MLSGHQQRQYSPEYMILEDMSTCFFILLRSDFFFFWTTFFPLKNMSVCLMCCSRRCTIFWKLLVAVRTWPMTNLTHLNKITASIHIIIHPSSSSLIPPLLFSFKKHCQRHNGRGGWVLLTKVTYFSHITSSNTKFDQISSWECWPSTKFKISTSANINISTKLKIQDIVQTWLQNLDQDSTSLPLQNISSKILTKLQLQILPELQLQNLDQTLCSKSEQKFCFITKPQLANINYVLAIFFLSQRMIW